MSNVDAQDTAVPERTIVLSKIRKDRKRNSIPHSELCFNIKAYQELKKRMSAPEAIVRIARKLLMRIRYVLVHRVPYRNLMTQ